MSITRRLNEEGIVETLAEGTVDLAEALRSIRQLEGLVRDGRLFEIVIANGNGEIHVGYEEGRVIAGSAVSFFRKLEAVVIALVAENDSNFGACRQIQTLMENGESWLRISVFREATVAMEWLREQKRALEEKAQKVRPPEPVAPE